LKRPDGFIEKLEASLNTLLPERKLMEELSQMLVQDVTVIPVNHSSEFRILHPSVHDSGYFKWSASTIFTPELMWLER
jgi:ABC-type oligopeptide transport system substrate-binding subunit